MKIDFTISVSLDELHRKVWKYIVVLGYVKPRTIILTGISA